ncbi:MAG: hypothetical protein OZ948_02935 [Deltaproteobacteria bacterium]|nr:hypothetical protein [Deltaproteobacteria bacterium]
MSQRRLRRESGSALIVTVLLLVLLGIVGLAALDTVQRDQQVAGFQNRSRLAFYAAEAGVADAKNRLRDVWSTDATVAFPDSSTPVVMGDSSLFPHGQPSYYADPLAAAGIEYLDAGAPSVGGGHDQRLGGSSRVNTLWRIRVEGTAPGGTTSRLEVVATRELDSGY